MLAEAMRILVVDVRVQFQACKGACLGHESASCVLKLLVVP